MPYERKSFEPTDDQRANFVSVAKRAMRSYGLFNLKKKIELENKLDHYVATTTFDNSINRKTLKFVLSDSEHPFHWSWNARLSLALNGTMQLNVSQEEIVYEEPRFIIYHFNNAERRSLVVNSVLQAMEDSLNSPKTNS